MNYKRFKNLTRRNVFKRFARITSQRLRCFKNVTKLKMFDLLSKTPWVSKHVLDQYTPIKSGDIKVLPNFSTDRFTYIISYLISEVEVIHQHWYSNSKGKILFKVCDVRDIKTTCQMKGELKHFVAHLGFMNKVSVSRSRPQIFHPQTQECDLKCGDYMMKRDYADPLTNELKVSDFIKDTYGAFKEFLTLKVSEVNKNLTGVDNDGEIISINNEPLADNFICSKCGLPLFMSSIDRYSFKCARCGEILITECTRVEEHKFASMLKEHVVLNPIFREYCGFDLNK